jgi:circadian clock protein KaiC
MYARSVVQDGHAAAMFLFDERPETLLTRSTGVGIDLGPCVKSGQLLIQQIMAAQITPGEFAQRVRQAVEGHGAKVIVIDSLTGYFNSMGNSSMLLVQMHELLTFLSRRGVLTILVVALEGFMSVGSGPPVDVSYLSDSILLLRLFEDEGTVRRCVSAIKKRQGEHETTIRELFIRPGSVSLGEEPLRGLRGILSGNAASISPLERGRGGAGAGGGGG